ncbi:FAD-dependent oxidoreductase [Sphingomonas sp. GCM10030256]|uniref:FAD-dependent oxidoreductase n=1 Tax=Sphingomonas sp. GCM10030256 TaxID=3273427 RepID=UPI0036088A03
MSGKAGRIGLLVLIAGAVAAFLLLGGRDYLSLEALKGGSEALRQWIAAHPVLAPAAFAAAYLLVVALSLPGAAVMTLAGGALFGLVGGTVLASLSSTAGATLAMLSARFLARDWVAQRFPKAVQAIDQGIERDGSLYLLSLRLAPIFPFFLINLAIGLTAMPAGRFFLLTMAGALPGTIVYTAAGTALASIDSLGDVLSPKLLGAFLALALLPLVGKAASGWLQRRRALHGFRRPRRFDANLIVIGAGSGGLVASLVAAELKAKVILVERGEMGGDCLNTGCVPSKSLLRAAKAAAEVRRAGRFGVEAELCAVDFRNTMAHLRGAIAAIAPNDSVERFRGLGVDVRQASARLVDPWTIEIDSRERLTARAILLATGADPVVPLIPGLAESGFVTSETLWDRLDQFDRVPQRVAILGTGPIGCELGQALGRLGADVTLVSHAERILDRDEPEASAIVAQALATDGVTILTGRKVERSTTSALHLDTGEAIPFDLLIVAAGRKPHLRGLGLEDLGLDPDTLAVDGRGRGPFGHVFVAGDAAGGPQFTHYAGHSGAIAGINALLGPLGRLKLDTLVPRVTYTSPEVASIGMTGADAPADAEIATFDVAHNDRNIADAGAPGMVKLVVRKGRVLGATIVADHAGELIMPWVLAIKRRIPLSQMMSVIYPYPTLSEVSRAAAGEWRRAHRPERVLRLAELFHSWRRG